MASKLEKFSKKYGFFTSEASSEEIVAISKELSDVMYDHTRVLSKNAITMLGISIVSIIFGLFLLTQVQIISGSWKTIVLFIRIAAIAMFITSAIAAYLAVASAEKGASFTPMMWRNVRESASDERVYEQMLATKKINKQIFTARNYVKSSALFIIIGAFLIGTVFLIQRLVEAGYLT